METNGLNRDAARRVATNALLQRHGIINRDAARRVATNALPQRCGIINRDAARHVATNASPQQEAVRVHLGLYLLCEGF